MKTCKHEGCNRAVFSHLYCGAHQNERTDDKWIASQKKQRDKMRSFKINKPQAVNPSGEYAMFMLIWSERPHVSYVSGLPLDRWEGTKLFVNLFSHLLPKGKYTEARLDKDNIRLLSPQEHLDWHSLTREKLLGKNPNWQKVFDDYDKMKEQYGTV